MIDLFLLDGLRPFLAAALVVVALVLLEAVLLAAGLSGAAEGAEVDSDFDLDADADAPGAVAQAAGLLGLGEVTLTLWLALFAALFASLGLLGQSFLFALTGRMLPAAAAIPAALVPALVLARGAARTLARLLPRDETAAISERSYGRRRGTVTVGTARRGSPAEVRFTDQHGNTHHLMAEPLDDRDTIPEGAEVLIMRTRDGQFRLVRTA